MGVGERMPHALIILDAPHVLSRFHRMHPKKVSESVAMPLTCTTTRPMVIMPGMFNTSDMFTVSGNLNSTCWTHRCVTRIWEDLPRDDTEGDILVRLAATPTMSIMACVMHPFNVRMLAKVNTSTVSTSESW